MKLVTFGIDQDKNLIIQFPMFVQPYMKNKIDPISNRNSSGANPRYK